ncbi:hypothetical protein [Pedobacter terrae]|uniref:hypothetical protein n=1 Tax=Pedobacter terrae TaxID=405671 RepID=UPI002FFA79BA
MAESIGHGAWSGFQTLRTQGSLNAFPAEMLNCAEAIPSPIFHLTSARGREPGA